MGDLRQDPLGRRRLLGIEGCRGIAASAIVVYHVYAYGGNTEGQYGISGLGPLGTVLNNLIVGVTLFFVLSGFLLFRPFVAAVMRGKPLPSVSNYFRNRALRILPAYWTILVFLAVVLDHHLLRVPQQLLANMFFAQDYVPSYAVTDGFHGHGINPAWSLAVEVVFYLLVPVLALIALRASRRVPATVAAWAPVVALILLGIGSKIVIRTVNPGNLWDLAFPVHADWFAAGMALAVCRVAWEDGRLRIPRWWPWVATVVALGLAAGAAKLENGGHIISIESQSVMAISCVLLLGLVVFAEPGNRIVGLLERRVFVVVGLASYSVFLWHDPLLRAVRDAGWTLPGRGGFLVNLLFVSVITAVASALTYRFVEKPALARKHSSQIAAPARPADRKPRGSFDESDVARAAPSSVPIS